MSRSKRKTPKRGITGAASEKEEKRDSNRKVRRKTKQQVNKGDEILSELREVSKGYFRKRLILVFDRRLSTEK
ncbi:MAG: hypothetical protein AAGG59_02630 [Bacteroidota bacterium]